MILDFVKNADSFNHYGFHPTLVGFIPSARTDLVEKNPHLSTTNVGSFMARPKGFEPPFFRIGICCVIQLRHERKY